MSFEVVTYEPLRDMKALNYTNTSSVESSSQERCTAMLYGARTHTRTEESHTWPEACSVKTMQCEFLNREPGLGMNYLW